MSNDLTQVDDLLRTDSISTTGPRAPMSCLRRVVNLESVVATAGYWIRQSADGIARLLNRSDGLRTDTMAGRLDPDATKAGAVSDLEQAQRVLEVAAAHLRAAHESLGRLFVDPENALAVPPSLTVVRHES